MTDAFICDDVRASIGGCGGAPSPFASSCAATPAWAIESTRSFSVAPTRQARTAATSHGMALLLAGLPETIPGATVNRRLRLGEGGGRHAAATMCACVGQEAALALGRV